MAYRHQKNPQTGTPEIIIDGFEKGIAASPHEGIGNMQGVNTSTETGEALSSFIRVQQSQTCGSGTLNQANATSPVVIFLTTTGGANWTVPSDWNSYDNSVEVIGAGGGGGSDQGVGGGGGGYAKLTSLQFTPAASIPYTVGTAGAVASAGGDTFFNGANLAASSIGAKGGAGGSSNNAGTGGAGGAASAAVYDYSDTNLGVFTAYTGGNGGQPSNPGGGAGSGGGGGGAAGKNGAGGNGAAAVTTTGGAGGQGDNGTGGAGGAAGTPGNNGGNGTEWDATHGSGGGAGGGSNIASPNGQGGVGGRYGGGGGGGAQFFFADNSGGIGFQGVIVITYRPVQQAMTQTSGPTLLSGQWINVTNGGTTGLSGNYYVTRAGGYRLSPVFAQGPGTEVNPSNGTATFTIYCMGKPIMSAYEPYTASDQTAQYRYYILDDLAQIWVHDTFTLPVLDTPLWFSPNLPLTLNGKTPSGLAVLNGWLTFTLDTIVVWKPTVLLGVTQYGTNNIQLSTKKTHPTLTGHQGKLYWGDGNFLASIFPNTSTLSGGANIQSYATYTAVTTTGTITTLIGGSYPNLATAGLRVPAVFYVPQNTTSSLPTALTVDTTYSGGVKISIIFWIKWLSSGTDFEVYAAATGGVALDIQTGAQGPQYFDTFSPLSIDATAKNNYIFTPQRLNLPFFETAQCMGELGNTVVIGGVTNTLYPWDQVSSLPGNVIQLPENNSTQIITVNSLLYVFAGQKGNIYITNGSSASFALSVPDYCAGIPGTPKSYIEPYFTWGGAAFLRGRVYFSILDQTSTKAGNCGGIWSFLPIQAGASTTSVGDSLRLENQNSYGSYNGVATVLLASQNQSAIAPQYWSGWYSNISAPLYGIDFTGTIPSTTSTIDTDFMQTGTMLDKMTYNQIEYKLAAPLVAGDSLAFAYRQDNVAAFTNCGTVRVESTTALSGYVPMNFQLGQWLQLQITYTPLASTTSSFIRLRQVIIR